jgi:hypothetical protein
MHRPKVSGVDSWILSFALAIFSRAFASNIAVLRPHAPQNGVFLV